MSVWRGDGILFFGAFPREIGNGVTTSRLSFGIYWGYGKAYGFSFRIFRRFHRFAWGGK
jgi:hypothetical protein